MTSPELLGEHKTKTVAILHMEKRSDGILLNVNGAVQYINLKESFG
jgi:hypothetical protein